LGACPGGAMAGGSEGLLPALALAGEHTAGCCPSCGGHVWNACRPRVAMDAKDLCLRWPRSSFPLQFPSKTMLRGSVNNPHTRTHADTHTHTLE
jgi:hypothetical protein